jgi:hypothetical protein
VLKESLSFIIDCLLQKKKKINIFIINHNKLNKFIEKLGIIYYFIYIVIRYKYLTNVFILITFYSNNQNNNNKLYCVNYKIKV